MKLIDRLKAPTPKFFKILRNIGLGLAAAGGVIVHRQLQYLHLS
jgi:hypothetical protein